MREPHHDPLNRPLAMLLQLGVLLSAAVLVAGLVLLAIRSGHRFDPMRFRHFTGASEAPLGALLSWEPDALLQLGLLLLLLVPLARLGLASILFTRTGDRTYAAISALVLAMVVLSTWIGRSI